jgi:hypothetical protein
MIKEISFSILDEHLVNGRRGNANQCAVSLALRESGYKKVGVFDYHFNFTDVDGTLWKSFYLPETLRVFIKLFDKVGPYNNILVKPASFTVEVQKIE